MQTNLELLKSYLRNEKNYLIATVTNANSALSKLKSHKFDLILLDIVMPVIDGIELCKILKNQEHTKNIPVIFLTAVSSDDVIIDAFDAGGVDYIKKPFNPNELKRKIHNHLELINFRKEIEKAKEEAEFANQAKSIFLGNISHELRTPLNGIVATLELLNETHLDANQKEMLEIAVESASNLTNILNDLLDLTKIESGILEIVSQPFSPKEMINNTLKIYKQKAESKNLSFNTFFDEFIPNMLIGDKYRTQQILMHLIDNALKFSDQGSIDISVELVEQNNSSLTLRYDVRDYGKGIAESQQKNIFDSFTQVENNNSRSKGGMGSGLSLVKKIVALLDGKIEVKSQLDIGSTFSFILNYTPITQSAEDNRISKKVPQKEDDFSHINALVVDDNIVNLKVAHMMLKNLGIHAHLAENGKEALIKYSIHKPNLIFMDIQMPEMDGLETTRKIRDIEHKEFIENPVPIIALTASAMKGDKEIFLNAGMNDYISKPFKKNDLEIILRKVSNI